MKSFFAAEAGTSGAEKAAEDATNDMFAKEDTQYGRFKLDLTVLHLGRLRHPESSIGVELTEGNPFISDVVLRWCPRHGCRGFAPVDLAVRSTAVLAAYPCPVCRTNITLETGADRSIYLVSTGRLADEVAGIMHDNAVTGDMDVHLHIVKDPNVSAKLKRLAEEGDKRSYDRLYRAAFGEQDNIGGNGALMGSVYYSAATIMRDSLTRGLAATIRAFLEA